MFTKSSTKARVRNTKRLKLSSTFQSRINCLFWKASNPPTFASKPRNSRRASSTLATRGTNTTTQYLAQPRSAMFSNAFSPTPGNAASRSKSSRGSSSQARTPTLIKTMTALPCSRICKLTKVLDLDFFNKGKTLTFFAGDMNHAITEMYSVQDGVNEMLVAHWPIVLGLVLVVIVVSLVLLALYKTNSFGKLRIFKGKIEEEENLLRNRRQSQLAS